MRDTKFTSLNIQTLLLFRLKMLKSCVNVKVQAKEVKNKFWCNKPWIKLCFYIT